jgi:DNA-binding NtrC family response regulator
MNSPKLKIAVADDDPSIVKILKDRLAAQGFQVLTARDGSECLALVHNENPSLLILDLQMPGLSGMELLAEIKMSGREVTVIILTAFGTVEAAVEAMKQGAYDFIQKPVDFPHLEIVINKALERLYLKRKSETLESQLKESEEEIKHLRREIGREYDFSNIIGNNHALQHVVHMIKKVVDQKSNIFIQGESGTGKELLARAIHYNSSRRDKNFVAVNCGAIPRELLESEFFGHVKGSFTNAHRTRKGYFEEAHEGTLFLDEIGELDLELQVKLLRALERDEIMRVGDPQPIKIDVRLITATNKNLQEQVSKVTFRKDLFYRLYVIPLTLSPLRERREDIPLLIDHFLKKMADKSGKGPHRISDEAMALFMNYSYPGNVRELENLIERSILLSDHPLIVPGDLPSEIRAHEQGAAGSADGSGGGIALKLVSKEAKLAAEKQMIANTLKAVNFNCSKAARILKISRSNLYNKIKRCTIDLARS